MKIKRLGCFLAALVIAAGMAGCAQGSTSEPSQSGNASSGADGARMVDGVDVSKEVHLVGYLVGDGEPAGMQEVMEALNAKYKEDINTTIEFRHISNADLTAKYPMILASGEDVDFVFAANWMSYANEAAKGAFRPITQDEFSAHMPRLTEELKDTPAFEDIKVNGEMFMMPCPSVSDAVPVFVIREDLRKKYNVPEVNSIADIDPYLEAIKVNEPGMIPMNCDGAYDSMAGPNMILDSSLGTYKQDFFQAAGSGSGLYWYSGEDYKVYSYKDEDVRARLKEYTTIVKGWADKGYINKDYFANKVPSRDSFAQGKSGVAFGNSINIQSSLEKAKQNGWETKVIMGLDKNGRTKMPSYTNGGIAIAATSKNAERVMLVMDRMMQDKEYNMLAYYGIEGKNYVINSEGKLDLPEGITPETNTYPPDAAGIWFTNLYQFPMLASWSDDYAEIRQSVRAGGILEPVALLGMNVDTTNIKTEIANVGNVMIQYFQPIRMGMVSDVDKAIDELTAKLEDAGYDKLYDELTRQAAEYQKTKQK